MFYQAENVGGVLGYRCVEYRKLTRDPHLHEYTEIAFSRAGSLHALVNGKEYHIPQGHMLMVLPNQIHEYWTEEESSIIVALFSADYAPLFFRQLGQRELARPVIDFSDQQQLFLALPQVDVQGHREPLLITGLLNLICFRSLQLGQPSQSQRGDGVLYQRAVQYISQNYTQPLSLQQTAAALGYNSKYLSSSLHRLSGMNFRRVLSFYRVDRAKHLLLENPRDKIAHIAFACGFSSVNTFNREFRAITGVSPKEFRQEKQGSRPSGSAAPPEALLRRFTAMSREVLGDNLLGVYLHGSAVMGCYNPEKSDLDLILVTEQEPTWEQKCTFLQKVLDLNRLAPKKGLELSLVRRQVCAPFVYPTPYELHFSPAHLERITRDPEGFLRDFHGTDRDLAAHFTVLRHQGRSLYGPEPRAIFAPVPREAYIDSILRDVENARKEISESPLYLTLNLCRVLAYLREGCICSKKDGGQWGLLALPESFAPLIRGALDSYAGPEDFSPDPRLAAAFADYMLEQIKAISKTK